MNAQNRIRVAALVDLPRSPQAGGHVKCWERLATAASQSNLPLDLTVYFSGEAADVVLGPYTRLRHLTPIFSTSRLKFLPYVPDHTDLASRHPRLERELKQYDVLHTTDGFFAYAQTAARVSRQLNIPLTTSFHTDTPTYTRIFTRQTIEMLLDRWPRLQQTLINDWKLPERQANIMQRKLERHLRQCSYAMVTRSEDHMLAERQLGKAHVGHLRLGIDRDIFGAHRRNREALLRDYQIPTDRVIILFIGRVDVSKNIHTLTEATEKLIREGVPLQLMVAGVGPYAEEIESRLGSHATLLGFVEPDRLAQLQASVDALVVPSEVEMRSMVCVEAMACGSPELVSKPSGIFELFDKTPAMMPVDSGVENWADALRHFAKDAGLRATMRQAAMDYGTHHLASWGDVLTQDLFVYWQAAHDARQKQAA